MESIQSGISQVSHMLSSEELIFNAVAGVILFVIILWCAWEFFCYCYDVKGGRETTHVRPVRLENQEVPTPTVVVFGKRRRFIG